MPLNRVSAWPFVLLLSLALTAICWAAEAPALPSSTQSEAWQEVYELSIDDGMLLVKGVDIAGVNVDAAVDTGCGDIILPSSVASQLKFEAMESLPALDYSGVSQDYPSGFLKTRRLGAQRETYESVMTVPDEQIGGIAILPFNLLQADLVCFICSEGRLVLCENGADWGDSAAAEGGTSGGSLHYIPYWENLGGIFLGIEIGGQRCFALLDTGASNSSVNAAFIAAHPRLFRDTGVNAEFTGIHGEGTTEAIYALTQPVKLLSIDGESDVGFSGDVAAMPAYTSLGDRAAAGDYGGDMLPYLATPSPNPWPVVMVVGMDLLAGYDFAFDTRLKLLTFMQQGAAAAE